MRSGGADENQAHRRCDPYGALWGTVRNVYRERPPLKMTPPYHSSKFWYIGGILAKEARLYLKLASNTEQIYLEGW